MKTNPAGRGGGNYHQHRSKQRIANVLPWACFQGNVFTDFFLYHKLACQVSETIVIKKILARWYSVAAFSAPFVWVFDREPTHCESLQSNDLNAAHYIAFLQLTGTLIQHSVTIETAVCST